MRLLREIGSGCESIHEHLIDNRAHTPILVTASEAWSGINLNGSLHEDAEDSTPCDTLAGMDRTRLLVTSFEPFGESAVNPTMEIAARLRAHFTPLGVAFVQLPVIGGTHTESARAVSARAIEEFRPSTVVHLGEAQGRSKISIERVAINVRDSRIADNDGVQVVDVPVVEGAPDAYFSTLPLRALVDTCTRAGIANEISSSAGTFLCNEVMFATLHASTTHASSVTRSGFIHVPQLPEQAAVRGGPSMSAEESARAIHSVLEALLRDVAV
ncbi:MAG: pyroglutamyl-peptidase I [Phycisphaerales bacterium]|nr:pyroglutamyl-peptidase I [Phycisphaerales bacterium]